MTENCTQTEKPKTVGKTDKEVQVVMEKNPTNTSVPPPLPPLSHQPPPPPLFPFPPPPIVCTSNTMSKQSQDHRSNYAGQNTSRSPWWKPSSHNRRRADRQRGPPPENKRHRNYDRRHQQTFPGLQRPRAPPRQQQWPPQRRHTTRPRPADTYPWWGWGQLSSPAPATWGPPGAGSSLWGGGWQPVYGGQGNSMGPGYFPGHYSQRY